MCGAVERATGQERVALQSFCSGGIITAMLLAHLAAIGQQDRVAAASYAVYYTLVGRFYISTDDAYVRANNTTLGARVSGHVAAILPRDNSLVRAGDDNR